MTQVIETSPELHPQLEGGVDDEMVGSNTYNDVLEVPMSDFGEITDLEYRQVLQEFAEHVRARDPQRRFHTTASYDDSKKMREIVGHAARSLSVFESQAEGLHLSEDRLDTVIATLKAGFGVLREIDAYDASIHKGNIGFSEFTDNAHNGAIRSIITGIERILPEGRVGEMKNGERYVSLDAFAKVAFLLAEDKFTPGLVNELSKVMSKFGISHYDIDGFVERTDPKVAAITLEVALHAVIAEAISSGRKLTDQEKKIPQALDRIRGLKAGTTIEMANHWGSNVEKDEESSQKKYREDRIHNVLMNVSRLIELEHSGVDVIELMSKYGIRNFSRYSVEKLKEQQGMERNPDGISLAMVAESDWNGSMSNAQRSLEQTGWDNIIFTEVGNMGDMARRLIFIRDRHGPVKQLVINAHGSEKGIFPGNGPDNRRLALTVENVKLSRGIARLVEKGLLDADCKVVLKSCEVGKEGGVAQAISNKTDLEVTAADFITSGIKVDKETGRIKLIQSDDDGSEDRVGQTHVYKSGKKVRSIS